MPIYNLGALVLKINNHSKLKHSQAEFKICIDITLDSLYLHKTFVIVDLEALFVLVASDLKSHHICYLKKKVTKHGIKFIIMLKLLP